MKKNEWQNVRFIEAHEIAEGFSCFQLFDRALPEDEVKRLFEGEIVK